MEGEVPQPIGPCDVPVGRICGERQPYGGVLDGNRNFGAHAAAQQSVGRHKVAAGPGDDHHLRPEFDVAEVRIGEEPVERPRQRQRRAVAVDTEVVGQETRAEGDLHARLFGEACEGFRQRRPLDGEHGDGRQQGAGRRVHAGFAPERGQHLGVLRGERRGEQGGGGERQPDHPCVPEKPSAPLSRAHETAPRSADSILTTPASMLQRASITLHTTVITSVSDFESNHMVSVWFVRASSLTTTSVP